MAPHTRVICVTAVLATSAGPLGTLALIQGMSTAPSADRVISSTKESADRSVQVDALFQDWSRGDTPGAAVVVVRDGKPIFKKGYGLANLEQGSPCTPQTKFRIVSLTKAFTAMVVMILYERGALNLDNAIGTYLPDDPKGDMITIRQLLTHTSGVQEPVPDSKAFDPLPVMNSPLERRYAMCRDEPLEFSPGEKWSYTNAGYIVLGYLIERVSGPDRADASPAILRGHPVEL